MTPKDSAGIFVRIWKLLHELSSTQGMTKEELAKSLSCNVRTVQRNLQLISTLGIPLREKAGLWGKKTYWIEQLPEDSAHNETIAAYLGRRYLEPQLLREMVCNELESAIAPHTKGKQQPKMKIHTETDPTRPCLYCGEPMEFTIAVPENPGESPLVDFRVVARCGNPRCFAGTPYVSIDSAKATYDMYVQNAVKKRRKS